MAAPRMRFTLLAGLAISLLLSGCGQSEPSQAESAAAAETPAAVSAAEPVATASSAPTVDLASVLQAQPAEVQARFDHRHPAETLSFFGIEPGMTVVEALPGGGWYSKLLLPVLGAEGQLIGANYAPELWPNFSFANEAFLERQKTWTTDWPAGAEEWRDDNSATVSAFVFSQLPESMHSTADAVLLIRALHNMARFEGGFLDQAIQDSFTVLKPGGVVGIVQHEARTDMPDDWANGSNGYLKKSFVIERMQAAGFELVGDSPINQNPKDQPTTDDFVWRLPPSFQTSRDNDELKAQFAAIGESHRMTLKFVKPAAGQ